MECRATAWTAKADGCDDPSLFDRDYQPLCVPSTATADSSMFVASTWTGDECGVGGAECSLDLAMLQPAGDRLAGEALVPGDVVLDPPPTVPSSGNPTPRGTTGNQWLVNFTFAAPLLASECPAGYTRNADSGTCSICEAGRYRPSGSVDGGSCTRCHMNSSSPVDGAIDSLCCVCDMGHIETHDAALMSDAALGSEHSQDKFCYPCPSGRYQMGVTCEPCAFGYYANDPASTSCSPMVSGWYGAKGIATKCPAGKYSPSVGAKSCDQCPAGKHSASGVSYCTVCAAGRFSNTSRSSTCWVADEGHCKSEERQTEQLPCVPGAANAAKGSPLCTECSPGKFANETGAAKCIPTRQGYFQHDSGQTQELPCPLGSVNPDTSAARCTECSPGKFANETGATQCIPTRQGYFQSDSGQTQELADCGLEHRDAEMSLEWAPRGENREADALADGRTEGFAPELRVGLDFSEITWLVLPGLMAAGMQFHGAFKRPGASSPVLGGASAASSRRKHGRLRDKEPW